MRRYILMLLALFALTGCNSQKVEHLRECAPAVQVRILDDRGTYSFGSATVMEERALLVSPHQLPAASRFKGGHGMLALRPNHPQVRYSVDELVPGTGKAGGYARLSIDGDAQSAPRFPTDFSYRPEVGTRIYIVGYPQGSLGSTATVVSTQRKVISSVVVRPRVGEDISGLEEFILVRLECGNVAGASGGPCIVFHGDEEMPITIGIFGGAFLNDDGIWLGLIRQVKPITVTSR